MHRIDIATHQIIFMVLFFAFMDCITRKEIRKLTSKFFISLLACDLFMLLSLILEFWFAELSVEKSDAYLFPMRIFACLDFVAFFALITLFVYYVLHYISQKTKVSWGYAHVCLAVCLVFAIGWCASIFTGMFFTVENGLFTPGKYYWFAQVGSFFVAFVTIFLVIRYFKAIGLHDALFFLSFVFLPILGNFVREQASFMTMQMAMSFSILLLFNFIHLNEVHLIFKQQAEIEKNKLMLSFSQIRPHFIFNTLNSIYVLCDKDPQKVKSAINDFSSYLRTLLDVYDSQELIPFKKEIEDLNHYLNLEHLRFRDDIYVSYDLQEEGFEIPPLTLQPLVENSIRHGILKRKDGGCISISTCRAGDYYKIKIADDGVGFDVSQLEERGGQKPAGHIGIRNVKDRLWILCRSTMDIRSEKGKGTSVIISIPVQNRESNEDYSIR